MFISQLETIAKVTQFGPQMVYHYIQLSTILNAQYLRVLRLCLQTSALDAVYILVVIIL
jgi:hypothetical protein